MATTREAPLVLFLLLSTAPSRARVRLHVLHRHAIRDQPQLFRVQIRLRREQPQQHLQLLRVFARRRALYDFPLQRALVLVHPPRLFQP